MGRPPLPKIRYVAMYADEREIVEAIDDATHAALVQAIQQRGVYASEAFQHEMTKRLARLEELPKAAIRVKVWENGETR